MVISIENWNNFIININNKINVVNITQDQLTNILSQFINDIINNNFENIDQIQFKNDIRIIISLFDSEVYVENLLNLTIETTDQSINNRVILIDIISEFYDIDWLNLIDESIKFKTERNLFNNHIKSKYNLLCQSSKIILPLKNIEDLYIQIADKSWDDKYINFIKSISTEYWNWYTLSGNSNIKMEMVNDNPQLPWNWKGLSKNPNITIDFISNNITQFRNWDWNELSKNPNITMDMVLSNLAFNWKISELSKNPNITMDTILNPYFNNREWDWEELSINSNITMNMVNSNFDLDWIFQYLSLNPNITMNMILSNRTENWDWKELSANTNITIEMVVSHQELPWDITYLSRNPNITIDIVKSNIHLPWNWKELSKNPNITMDMVLSHPELPWDIEYLSINPNITMDLILNNIKSHFDWDELSFNSMKKNKEQYIKKKVDELKLIDEFKLINRTNNLFPNVIETVIITYILT